MSEPSPPSLPAIILAAGLSSRMGAFKPLLPLGDKPLIAHVISALQFAGLSPIYIVTGHESAKLQAALQNAPVRFVHNKDYAQGEMLSSVQTGLAALPPDAPAALLALGDQPAVKPATVQQIVAAWQTSRPPLVLPLFEGHRGHPILLSRPLWPDILSLPQGQTLKTVIHHHLSMALQLETHDPAVTADMDTPDDYHQALAQFKTRP